ncbi:hypothetical protein ILYODFUR_032996 [Ilyodon furcidens]|uniref:Uncharacterized protein n=1 Tax=Ilyodon furcidens TaxID=33524 RepID=A0ABV0SS81_9TELE
MASRLSFGLVPVGSCEEQPGHQALSDESRPQAWLHGWDPGSAVPGDVTCLNLVVVMKVSFQIFIYKILLKTMDHFLPLYSDGPLCFGLQQKVLIKHIEVCG